jgi:hypothetical protein
MLHPGRFAEGSGRVSGRKTGRFSREHKTLHPERYPEGPGRSRKGSGRVPEVKPKGFFHVPYVFVVGSPGRFELVPGEIRKETGRYLEATFAEKCNLKARAHLVTVNAPWQTCPPH